ncbi:MAG: hypothetical protein ACXAD7_09955 [Candidatus Kariarchaeaceae archaeon]|jgi:hypothetical protein
MGFLINKPFEYRVGLVWIIVLLAFLIIVPPLKDRSLGYEEGTKFVDQKEVTIKVKLDPGLYYLVFDASGIIGDQQQTTSIRGDITLSDTQSNILTILPFGQVIEKDGIVREPFRVSNTGTTVTIDFRSYEAISGVIIKRELYGNLAEADNVDKYYTVFLIGWVSILIFAVGWYLKPNRAVLNTDLYPLYVHN